jgi:hypothetical protein
MTKQNYTMYIYKADKRKKTGERIVSITVWEHRDDNGMRREVANLFDTYNPDQGYRFEWFPAMTSVKSMMTGTDVMIRTEDKGTFMDPSQERYWSM